jgi:hypothetical protein
MGKRTLAVTCASEFFTGTRRRLLRQHGRRPETAQRRVAATVASLEDRRTVRSAGPAIWASAQRSAITSLQQ